MLREAWSGGRDGGLAHVMAYGEPGGVAERVAGVLDDYVFLGHAALDAWESTGELRYYEAAVELMESALRAVLRPRRRRLLRYRNPRRRRAQAGCAW